MFRIRHLQASLAGRVGHLTLALSDLGRRLRSAIASRLAEGLAGVVREAVETTLAEPEHAISRLPYHPFQRASSAWREEPADEPALEYPPVPPGSLFNRYRQEPDTEDDDVPPQTMPPPSPVVKPELRQALLTGLQASAWCLGRRSSGSLLITLAVGVSAFAVALFGGSAVAQGAAAVCSLLALAG